MCIWFLCVLPRIVREFMDAVIEQIKEEAKRRHEDPPEIDEEAIIKIVVSLVTTLLVIAEALGVLVKLYFVWVIKSCAYWMQRGIDPYAPIYVPTAQVPITGTTLQAYQPANVILGPPIAAPASDHPTASLLVTQGPQNPTAPVFSAAQLSGSYQHESNVGGPPNASHPAAQGERSDAYPRLHPAFNIQFMRAFFYLWFSNLAVLSVAERIQYRNYTDGDEYEGVKLIKCKFMGSIPCYVAVDTDKSAKTVVGYIMMYVPFPVEKKEEQLVRAKLLKPKQKGKFGRIHSVEVDKNYQRHGIGRQLVTYAIEKVSIGRKAKDALAMTLWVRKDNTPAISLYEKLNFINVGDYLDVYEFAYYYAKTRPTTLRRTTQASRL
ncbi:hypothetical protein FOL47_003410 [Perkinsus chesapeaki]|uniref:N-acetyltransferase domain-containing protein n=1 Tax=Perkinsus chesapeaki TaxID=330153 RepID=A0A7J6M9N2_PERCH|nr:hypothetical protein FOL47_003410 [Perkinsus chesapeaki]